jgi:hypothetical protein
MKKPTRAVSRSETNSSVVKVEVKSLSDAHSVLDWNYPEGLNSSLLDDSNNSTDWQEYLSYTILGAVIRYIAHLREPSVIW